jgi:hypothetical protein
MNRVKNAVQQERIAEEEQGSTDSGQHSAGCMAEMPPPTAQAESRRVRSISSRARPQSDLVMNLELLAHGISPH